MCEEGRISRIKIFFLCILMIVVCPNLARAWLRARYEDAVIIDRSELIVVGHLREGSIQYVAHKKKPHGGASWEHHADLVITEVLKGRCEKKEIPVVIHYGLTPVVGGYFKCESSMINLRGGRRDYPKRIVEIVDTGSSARGRPPLVQDARRDNLWFLRRRSGTFGRKSGTGKYGILDPEDLQALEWKDYFLCYLADDPETKVRNYVAKHPDSGSRGKRYLDHLAVQRLLKIKDPNERFEQLLPYYVKRFYLWHEIRSERRHYLVRKNRWREVASIVQRSETQASASGHYYGLGEGRLQGSRASTS